MIPTIKIENLYPSFDGEISQDCNGNAYTRLFLLPQSDEVAKICYTNQDLWEKNLANLQIICDKLDAEEFQEIVFPTAFIEYHNELIGYTMPFIDGKLLACTIQSDVHKCGEYLDKLISLISRLPDNIHIGDLHGRNILITKTGEIRLIDLDGFSVDDGFQMTCPLVYDQYLASNLFFSKYFNLDYTTHISKNTDIFCVINIFFESLLDGLNPYRFSPKRLFQFFQYLYAKGVPSKTINMLEQITNIEDNYTVDPVFSDFFVTISYDDFIKHMNLESEEKYYIEYINQIIKKEV